MNISASSVQFVRSTAVNSTTRNLLRASLTAVRTFTVMAVVRTTVPLIDFPVFLGHPEALYVLLTAKLSSAVSSGNFTASLRLFSIALGANLTIDATVTSVSQSAPTVSDPPSDNVSGGESRGALGGGAIAGIVIGALFVAYVLAVTAYSGSSWQRGGSSKTKVVPAPKPRPGDAYLAAPEDAPEDALEARDDSPLRLKPLADFAPDAEQVASLEEKPKDFVLAPEETQTHSSNLLSLAFLSDSDEEQEEMAGADWATPLSRSPSRSGGNTVRTFRMPSSPLRKANIGDAYRVPPAVHSYKRNLLAPLPPEVSTPATPASQREIREARQEQALQLNRISHGLSNVGRGRRADQQLTPDSPGNL